MYFDKKIDIIISITTIVTLKIIFFFDFILSIHKLFSLNNHDLFYLSERY